MLTSAPAGDPAHGRRIVGLGFSQACSSDRHQADVGVDQALRTEPGGLEGELDVQARVIRARSHGRLHQPRPQSGAWDGESTGLGQDHPMAILATRHTRSGPTTRSSSRQHCTSDHNPSAWVNREPDLIGRLPDDLNHDAARRCRAVSGKAHIVHRQGFWDRRRAELREALAHPVGQFRRRMPDGASAAAR